MKYFFHIPLFGRSWIALLVSLVSAQVNITFSFIRMPLWCKWYHQSKQKADTLSFRDSFLGSHTYRRLLTAVQTSGQCGLLLSLFYNHILFFPPVSSFYCYFAFMCFRPRLILYRLMMLKLYLHLCSMCTRSVSQTAF